MRDLGHEQPGPHARRLWNVSVWLLEFDASHGCAGFERWSVRKLQRSYRRDSRHLGAMVAATMGLLPSALSTQRTAATQLLGVNKLQRRSMASALAPNAKYDPLFDVTFQLVQDYATHIWDGRINPGLLVRARKAWVQRRSSKPSWHGVRGPLGAVIMSLRRIGWSLEKWFALRSDTDELINMLQTPPLRVVALVEREITRWQMRDAARSLVFDPLEGPDIWLRHVRYMLHLFTERPWSACESQHVFLHGHGRLRMALNLRTDPSCSSSGYARGTFAHQWYACPGMFPIAPR